MFRVKYKFDGSVERYKVILVAKGYSQQEGVNYFDTFSTMAKMVTVRSVLVLIASIKNLHLFQMDVYNAFLQGDLNENVFMDIPPRFNNQGENKMVCRLLKLLYGLKQTFRRWNVQLSDALIKNEYVESKYDYSMFTKKSSGNIFVLLVYVDDLLGIVSH